MTIYHPVRQMGFAGRLFVRAAGDPYALVPAGRRGSSARCPPDQPVERAATLEDVRAEVLAPERLNAFVFSGFAGIALLIAVVGVAGVLAFSVSARTREFGVRLAVGSAPRHLLTRVLSEGVVIAVDRHRRRRRRRLRARAVASRVFVGRAACQAPCPSLARRGRAHRRGRGRVADAGRARLARRRAAGAAIGVGATMERTEEARSVRGREWRESSICSRS